MGKIQVSKGLILSIASQDNKKFVKNINTNVNELLTLSIDALSKKVSYINIKNVVLQPANEILNNSFLNNSNCIYLLGIDNPQLEINSTKQLNLWRNFKERLKFAWQNRKSTKRKRKRLFQRKKYVEQDSKPRDIKIDSNKYSVFDLAEDLQNSLVNFLSETTLIKKRDSIIEIYGKDDFGSTSVIVLYLMSYSDGIFKYFKPDKRKNIEIDINSRMNAITSKSKLVGVNFTKMLKIYNMLYYNVNGKIPNQILIESILCACPENLFEGKDIYKVFLKISNYFLVQSIRNVKSINNLEKSIYDDVVCGYDAADFMKMLRNIEMNK